MLHRIGDSQIVFIIVSFQNKQGLMFNLWAVHKTDSTTVQKSPNLRRTFRTRGRQISILGADARPKNIGVADQI